MKTESATTTSTAAVRPDFAAIVRENADTLYTRALALTGSPSDAWDLVQSTFERALRSRPTYLGSAEMRGWLLAVMRNLFCDRWRTLRSRRHVPLTDQLAAQLAPPPSDEPEDTRWRDFTLVDVRRAVERLSPPVKAAFTCSLEGLSTREISQQLDVPLPTVCTRLFRGRQRLRRILESELSRGPARAQLG